MVHTSSEIECSGVSDDLADMGELLDGSGDVSHEDEPGPCCETEEADGDDVKSRPPLRVGVL